MKQHTRAAESSARRSASGMQGLTTLAASLVVVSLASGCGATIGASKHPGTDADVPARPNSAVSAPSAVQRRYSDAVRWTTVATHHHGVMLGMRLTEVWLWPEPFADTDAARVSARYRAAVSQPPKWRSDARWFEWDGDRWWINVVGHSLFGSELYLAARRCEFSPLVAFASSAAASAVWEYGYEASGVRPSALDLVYTPLSGFVLGEFRHWAYREADGLTSGPLKVLVRVLMDPLGTLERGFGAPC